MRLWDLNTSKSEGEWSRESGENREAQFIGHSL